MPVNEISLQLKTLFGSMTSAKRFTLLTLVCATIAGFIFLMVWSAEPDFQPLYSNLAPEDAGAILTRLKEKKIPYKISPNHDSIMVPGGQIYEIRLALASQGLPLGSGVGFEIFDNAKLGMTEFVQNVNFQRALQGELSRTINRFDEVQSSRVHIVMPSKSLFAEDEEPATASVILKLGSGKMLSKGQVQSIVHLVSSSVSGLSPEKVTLVDNYGKMLTRSMDRSSAGPLDTDQLALQEKMEKRLEKKIQTMLETSLGPGQVIARVSYSLDFRREEKTEERYHPDNKAIRSEQILNEISGRSGGSAEGVPGILSNTREGQAALSEAKKSEEGKGESFKKQERTVNYEITKVTSHIVEPYAKVMRISAAVIVDGIHKYIEAKKGKKGKKEKGEWKYIPRSQEEMDKLERIVKRAVNFDPKRGDKIEVVNIAFKKTGPEWGDEDVKGTDQGWLSQARQYAPSMKFVFLAIFLLLLFMFIVKPLVRWLTSNSAGKEGRLMQLPQTLSEMESEYGQSLPHKDKAVQLIAKDEEHSLKLMKRWLGEEQV